MLFFALNAECETVCGVYLHSKSPAGFRIAIAQPIPVLSVLAQLLDFKNFAYLVRSSTCFAVMATFTELSDVNFSAFLDNGISSLLTTKRQ